MGSRPGGAGGASRMIRQFSLEAAADFPPALVDPAAGARRRRRPTGAPPPMPKSIGRTGKLWLVLLLILLAWVPAAMTFAPVLRLAERADTAFLRQAARVRTPWLTRFLSGVDRLGSGWLVTVLAVAMIVSLLVSRRWRHLFTLVGGIAVFEIVGSILYQNFARPRPFGVNIIGRWSGYSMPSPPVAVLSAILVGIAYTAVVPGRPRTIAKWVIGLVIIVFVGARLYLAVDHPSDVIVGVAVGVSLPLIAFRLFAPNEVFPVSYGRGKTAHLDIGGLR